MQKNCPIYSTKARMRIPVAAPSAAESRTQKTI